MASDIQGRGKKQAYKEAGEGDAVPNTHVSGGPRERV